MAKSVCPKCGHDKFELGDSNWKNAKLLQCADCGSVLSVIEDLDFEEKFNKVYINQNILENNMNLKSEEIKSIVKNLNEKNDTQIEYLERICGLLRKLIK